MQKNLTWTLSAFDMLSINNLYNILHLRNKVFIVEQNDIYLDIDYLDQQAFHLMGFIDEQLVAYCRIFPPKEAKGESKIGRVIIHPDYREYGIGRLLMDKAIETNETSLNAGSIYISAQVYLQKFYESLGFISQGEPYIDGSIKHIDMRKQKSTSRIFAFRSCK